MGVQLISTVDICTEKRKIILRPSCVAPLINESIWGQKNGFKNIIANPHKNGNNKNTQPNDPKAMAQNIVDSAKQFTGANLNRIP